MLAKLEKYEVPHDASTLTSGAAKKLYDAIPEIKAAKLAAREARAAALQESKAQYAVKQRAERTIAAKEIGFKVTSSTTDEELQEMQLGHAHEDDVEEIKEIAKRLTVFSITLPFPKYWFKYRVEEAVELYGSAQSAGSSRRHNSSVP